MSNTAPVPAAPAASVPAVPTGVPAPIEGLEDFDASDVVMPTLRINHKEATYKDGLSGEEFPSLEVVILGLVKQRILWDAEVSGDSDAPLCKSYDHANGVPDPKAPHRFPWKESGYNMADFDTGAGIAPLPCEGCALSEWGSHPKNETPYCAEQYTLVVMMPVVEEDGSIIYAAPALLSLQRSAVKPAKAYISSFQRSRSPLFIVTTKLGLNAQRRGTVDFATPTLVRGEPTDAALHPEWAANYRLIRESITAPRIEEERAPAQETTTVVAAPATNTTPAAASVSDDEMPF